MKTENKYYTPEISEFHVGFEYEEDDNNTNNWKKELVYTCNDLDYFDDLIREGNIRVKYLDCQDVLELEWRQNNNPLSFSLNGFDILLSKNNTWITIYEDKGADEYSFRGNIKNKSELKRLMQQLNIK